MRPWVMKRWFQLGCFAVSVLATVAIDEAARGQSVLTYHGAPSRSGLYTMPQATWAAAAGVHMDTGFNATVTGNVYAQPLYWLPPGAATGQIIVATESNIVSAHDATTGAEIWHRSLGTAASLGQLQCGNINPMGVTGTPVIDPAAHILYLAALVDGTSGPRHQIFAVSLNDGSIVPGWPVDVGDGLLKFGQTFTSTAQGQRSALTIVAGKLYVTYAGYDGDCGTYHGLAVGLRLGTPKIFGAWATRAHGGGVWGQGGIAYDGRSMFMVTGNTMGASTWSDGEAVIRVKPALAHSTLTQNFFTPQNWQSLDNTDLDLGGTGVVPIDVPGTTGKTLPRLLALGKDGNAYLLNRNNLGGIGGQLALAKVSTDQIRTAPATYNNATSSMVAFEGRGANCPSGQSGNLTMLTITASSTSPITTAWCGAFSGAGAPIVTTTDGTTDPIVWIVGAEGDNRLHAFRGTDGQPLFTGGGPGDAMSGLHHFQTILVAAGRFYVAGDGKVYAFGF